MIRPGPYVCLDVGFFEDERVAKCSGSARLLLLKMLCYCSAELTDGRVPSALLAHLYVSAGARAKHLEELVAIGLVERLGLVENSPIADDYYLPAYLSWNMAKADLDAERAAARERQRQLRERRDLERSLGVR